MSIQTLLLTYILLWFVRIQYTSAQSPWPQQTFNTSTVRPPVVKVTKFGKTESGYLFVSPVNLTAFTGLATIFTDDGQLVWYGPNGYSNLRVQTLNGKPVLIAFNGTFNREGLSWGSFSIFDDTYTDIYDVKLIDSSFQTPNHVTYPSYLDGHENEITSSGTLLSTAFNITTADMSSVGGPKNGWVLDSLFYEIDIVTNQVLFRWSALEHISEIPLNSSLLPLNSTLSGNGTSYNSPWGYFHINSIAKYGGNYLISSRLLCTVFYLDSNGNVIWRLQGRDGGDFQLGPGTNFCYQHIPRIIASNSSHITLTMHDNGDTEYDNHTLSQGLALDIDLSSKYVSLNRALKNPANPIYSTSQGSYQSLPNGHALLGHGSVPVVEEYDSTGSAVLTFQFGPYYIETGPRSFRSAWTGKPKTLPSVAAYSSGNVTDVYMSWNGATDVIQWNIYSGSASTQLQLVTSVARNGFETQARISQVPKFVQVEAISLDGNGTKSTVTGLLT